MIIELLVILKSIVNRLIHNYMYYKSKFNWTFKNRY